MAGLERPIASRVKEVEKIALSDLHALSLANEFIINDLQGMGGEQSIEVQSMLCALRDMNKFSKNICTQVKHIREAHFNKDGDLLSLIKAFHIMHEELLKEHQLVADHFVKIH